MLEQGSAPVQKDSRGCPLRHSPPGCAQPSVVRVSVLRTLYGDAEQVYRPERLPACAPGRSGPAATSPPCRRSAGQGAPAAPPRCFPPPLPPLPALFLCMRGLRWQEMTCSSTRAGAQKHALCGARTGAPTGGRWPAGKRKSASSTGRGRLWRSGYHAIGQRRSASPVTCIRVTAT